LLGVRGFPPEFFATLEPFVVTLGSRLTTTPLRDCCDRVIAGVVPATADGAVMVRVLPTPPRGPPRPRPPLPGACGCFRELSPGPPLASSSCPSSLDSPLIPSLSRILVMWKFTSWRSISLTMSIWCCNESWLMILAMTVIIIRGRQSQSTIIRYSALA
jgi:hypothetical protein